MDKDYIISAVSEETKKFPTKFGELVTYFIKFEDGGDVVQLNQKLDTPAPTVGQKLFGHLEPTPYGMKFKKASQFDQSAITQPAFGGFTDEDRKMLKEIYAEVCPAKAERADIDSEPVNSGSIPF